MYHWNLQFTNDWNESHENYKLTNLLRFQLIESMRISKLHDILHNQHLLHLSLNKEIIQNDTFVALFFSNFLHFKCWNWIGHNNLTLFPHKALNLYQFNFSYFSFSETTSLPKQLDSSLNYILSICIVSLSKYVRVFDSSPQHNMKKT
jgi:hypothetical protein